MPETLTDLLGHAVAPDLSRVSIALVVSLVASVLCQFLVELFHERRASGSQIQRSFVLLGPSITLIFITVQISLPLSLGLLGALSIVRFRVPIKEPEEIGFLMVLIGSSIACATSGFGLVAVLLTVVVAALTLRSLLGGNLPLFRRHRGRLLITFSAAEDSRQASEALERTLEKVAQARLEYVVRRDGRTTFSYSLARRRKLDWAALEHEVGERHQPLEVAVTVASGSS